MAKQNDNLFKLLISGLTLGLALQTVYTAAFGVWDPVIHRPIILALGVIIAVWLKPLAGIYPDVGKKLKIVFWAIDLAMLAIVLTACYLYIDIGEELEHGLFDLDIKVYYTALAAMLVLLELTRRSFGLPLFLTAAGCLVYVLYGEHLPGVFRHAGYDVDTAMQDIWFSTTGVFGLPMAIMLNLIFIFIILGAVLEGTGSGDSLLRISLAVTGRTRGGPAYAAIIASALFGTMSGSVIANIVGTGTITIPLIKKRGFSGEFAGAVESAASTGGQIMPPVMGVAAFMMAEFTGVPYLYIIVAAAIPALLFYISLFFTVSLETRRLGITPLPPDEQVKLKKEDYLRSLMFIAPIITIIVVLLSGRSATMAGFAATMMTILFAFIHPDFRAKPWRLFQSLAKGGKACSNLLIVVGTLGIIIGTMNLTGLGIRLAQVINSISGDGLFVTLILTMVCCLILGMGMPTLSSYITVSLVLGPAIMTLGIPGLVIHMFIFYYGVLSAITPPVALAAYAAAPITGSNPMITGIRAVRVAIIAFIIPFIFVYNPQLLIISAATQGTFDFLTFSWILLRSLIALWLFTTAVSMMDRESLPIWSIGLRLLVGVSILLVDPIWQWGGLFLALGLLVQHHFIAPRKKFA